MAKKSNIEEFINKAREIHGDKYDYSKVEYINNNTPVTIICPKHGEFEQTPHSHKSGQGCPMCNKITKNIFLIRAREKFGWKYDYSKMEYVNYTTKICIIHPEYGEFWQTPQNHLSSKSGSVFKHEKKIKKIRKKSKKEKLSELFWNAVKNREYDYSKVVLKTQADKITIICPKHGEFTQQTIIHIKGGVCPKCLIDSKKDDKESFVKKAKEVHGNKYDYSKVEYLNSQTKVDVICHEKDALGNEHGIFQQKPNTHLCGRGCPKCRGLNKTTDVWLAEVKNDYINEKYTFENAVFNGARQKITITCKKHGDFDIIAREFARGHGCPKCQMPSLERNLEKFLKENNINYKMQKKFSWLGLQSLDFYLPDYNIAIECQGEQHFIDKDFFKKRENLNIRKERDLLKKQLCKENNIKLIYFLEKKFVKYLEDDDIYFTDINKILEIVKEYGIHKI